MFGGDVGASRERVEHRRDLVGGHAQLGQAAVTPLRAASDATRVGRRVGVAPGADRDRELGDLLRRARAHQVDEVRQHHGVGGCVRRAGDAHDRLADGVVHREAGDPRGVTGEDRAQRERFAVGQLGLDALGQQARGRAARPCWRRDSRAACRAPPSHGRERSSRWRPARGASCEAISDGTATHQRRPHQAGDLNAGRHPVEAGHLGARQRRRHGGAANAGGAGDRLGGVDHAAAAEGDQRPALGLVASPRRPPRAPARRERAARRRHDRPARGAAASARSVVSSA